MQFIVLGYDGKDEDAPTRRVEARENHLKNLKNLYTKGIVLYASAILDDNEKMCGSMIVCQFESVEGLKKQWLDSEPYVIDKVWQNIEIKPTKVAGFCSKA